MVIKPHQIFNLMDTNGRRNDVLNALKLYLEILDSWKWTAPADHWGSYPASLSQFLFYQAAVERSKDVFKVHKSYDQFISKLGVDYGKFLAREPQWVARMLPSFSKVLDESVEKRARHYTSTLVKIGFTDGERNITEAGYEYLRGTVRRDPLEEILPLDSINLTLLRQLSKLKIFGTPGNGKRQYYAPFLMALLLLLEEETVDRPVFERIVQGLSPYSSDRLKEVMQTQNFSAAALDDLVCGIDTALPDELAGREDIPYPQFAAVFKSSKNSDAMSQFYYGFFCAVKRLRTERSQAAYDALLQCFATERDAAALYKAFGDGNAPFALGKRGNRYSLEQFLAHNADHPLFCAQDYVKAFYTAYVRSKWTDGIREYSDTTLRLLSATGLFRFRNLPELAYREVLSELFNLDWLRTHVFGEMTEEEYCRYEAGSDSVFRRSTSLTEIFHYSDRDTDKILRRVEALFSVQIAAEVRNLLDHRKQDAFLAHIREKYPRKRILELLPLFSDRRKDPQIKQAVNDGATVPTIYEYIIGIAWYYISRESFDLYHSLNLTLNADFEPVIHAGGGDGDIVIHYEDIIVMLEVTMMNKQAQKRGEWEPVLRHSLNLKAAHEPKPTLTFFIADELDYNTINIWRAVAAASLESTNTHKKVDGVQIMPFTNRDILHFLEGNVYHQDIIQATTNSFARIPRIADTRWHEEVVEQLLHKA